MTSKLILFHKLTIKQTLDKAKLQPTLLVVQLGTSLSKTSRPSKKPRRTSEISKESSLASHRIILMQLLSKELAEGVSTPH